MEEPIAKYDIKNKSEIRNNAMKNTASISHIVQLSIIFDTQYILLQCI